MVVNINRIFLHVRERSCYLSLQGGVPKWLRERSAKPRFSGSNPLAASSYEALSFNNRNPRPFLTKKLFRFVPTSASNRVDRFFQFRRNNFVLRLQFVGFKPFS